MTVDELLGRLQTFSQMNHGNDTIFICTKAATLLDIEGVRHDEESGAVEIDTEDL